MAATNQIETGQIMANAITYPLIQLTSSQDVVLGRDTTGAGQVLEITCTAFARSMLDDVAASDVRTTLGLAAMAIVSSVSLTGHVTGSGTSSIATTIANGVVTEAMQTLSNVTTGNVSITKHGYAPILPNDATKYLDGTGAYSTPAGSGSGSVTTVSVVTANGVSGSVANPTTTPAITLTLGAITPSSVAATGNMSATGTVTSTVTGVAGSVTTDGLIARNTTAATNVVSQNPPTIRLTGFGWSGGASQQIDWVIANNITAGGTVNTLSISNKIGAGASTTLLSLDSPGTLTLAGGINATTCGLSGALTGALIGGTTITASVGFTGDGTNLTKVGRITGIQTFTTGSGTYTPTAGTTAIRVIVIGGGGGGGGGDGGSGTAGAGAGGGGGGYAEKVITGIAASYDYSVGTGGGGATAGNNSGTGGNNTTFSTHGGAAILTGSGGGGGPSMATGSTVTSSSTAAGGSATGGSVNIAGGAGRRGIRLSGTQAIGGAGGDSMMGRGGYFGVNLVGNGGSGFGGGGGGGSSATVTDTAGGDGTDGVVVIYEYA